MIMKTIEEICEYYGQIYENVKHMDLYVKRLEKQYLKELNKWLWK